MGYYTDYKLLSMSEDFDKLNIENVSEEVIEFLEDQEIGGVKWYDHIKDMLNLSKENPDVLFHTSGVGEENGDQWEAKFLDGKYKLVNAEVIIPSFDTVNWR